MSGDDPHLDGLRVLVTRPAHQADAFCTLVERAGGVALRLPALVILPPPTPDAAEAAVVRLDDCDIVVFTSPNAVEGMIRLLGVQSFPHTAIVAAVGASTADTLATHSIATAIRPAGRYDSEGLLAEPALQDVAGRKILLVRGEGGRDAIATTLAARGATVNHAVVYRRSCPNDGDRLNRLLREGVDIIAVTSGEALTNLVTMAGAQGRARLLATPLVVGSRRIAEMASTAGFAHPAVIADNPDDEAMLAALERLAKQTAFTAEDTEKGMAETGKGINHGTH